MNFDKELIALHRRAATQNVLEDVAQERERQHGKFDGVYNDDKYTPFDWHEMIADYNGGARRESLNMTDMHYITVQKR